MTMGEAFDSIMRGLQEVKGSGMVMCPNPHYDSRSADICTCCHGERWVTKERAAEWLADQEEAHRCKASAKIALDETTECMRLLDSYFPSLDMTRYAKLKWLIEVANATQGVAPIIEELKKELGNFRQKELLQEDPLRDCPR
jgi:transposase